MATQPDRHGQARPSAPPPRQPAQAQPPRPAAPAEEQEPALAYKGPLSAYTGWFVAGGVGLVLVVILVVFLLFPSGSGRVRTNPRMLKFRDLGVSPQLVIGSVPSAAGNAGDDYYQAVTVMKQNMREIAQDIGEEDYLEDSREDLGIATEDPDDMRGRRQATAAGKAVLQQIEAHVKAGAQKAKMDYTFVHTPRQFEVGRAYRPAHDLLKVASALDTLRVYYEREKNLQAAEDCIKAVFVLGWHMMNERRHPDMVRQGMEIQSLAIEVLEQLYQAAGGQKAQRLDSLNAYNMKLLALKSFWSKKSRVVWNIRPEPGDIRYVVDNDKDLSWRVQGLLALGLVRHAPRSRGDLKLAQATLAKYAASKDPVLAAAARAAQQFTREQFNQIGARTVNR